MPARKGSGWTLWIALALLVAIGWLALHDAPPLAPAQTPTAQLPERAEDNPLAIPPPISTPAPRERGIRYPDFLPPEAIDTLRLIARGGPYPHRQDDGVFGNREARLPLQSRGYYREYTVETPGSRDRGARRIIAGGRPPTEFFYTDDHYRSFRRFTLDGTEDAR